MGVRFRRNVELSVFCIAAKFRPGGEQKNRRGLKTEPWGTPELIWRVLDLNLGMINVDPLGNTKILLK